MAAILRFPAALFTLTSDTISMTGATNTIIGSTPYDLQLIECHVRLVSVTGFTTEPTVSVGTNATSYDNIIGATTLTGLSTADDTFAFTLSQVKAVVPASTSIRFRVSTGATATTYTGYVSLVCTIA